MRFPKCHDTLIISYEQNSEIYKNSTITQLAIMQYALSCEAEYYMVWDSRSLPCHDIMLFDDRSGKPYIDLRINDDSDSDLSIISLLLPGIRSIFPGSFDTGHILINTGIMQSLIADIDNSNSVEGSGFIQKIINCIAEDPSSPAFNLYELYGVYVSVRYPSKYKVREWNCFTQGSVFFTPESITTDDLTWLSKDFDSVMFTNDTAFIREYSDLFRSTCYREKLTPSQMLNAIFTDTEDKSDVLHNIRFDPVDRLKYLDRETYKAYENLGDELIRNNLNQAYLCYENAVFLSDDAESVNRIRTKMQALSDTGKISVIPAAFIIISYNNLAFTAYCLESI